MAFKNLRLGSDTSRLILLFVAILPATESKDWLFYTVSVLQYFGKFLPKD